jgi:hypothetical protein
MTDQTTKPVPPPQAAQRNTTALISGVLLLLMLLAGGYVLLGGMFSSGSERKDLVPVMPAGAGRNWVQRQLQPQGQPRVQPDGVRVRGANSYQVKAGEYQLGATKSKDGKWTLRFTTDRRDILTPEQDVAFDARWRLTHDGAFAKSLALTADQIKRLGEIPGKGGLIVDPPGRDRVQAAIEAFAAAKTPRNAEEAAVVAAVAEVGVASIEPTRKSLLERVDQIRATLTPEQLEQFTKPRR